MDENGVDDEFAGLTYEDGVTQLQAILTALEEKDLPLEESLHLYEQGTRLATFCSRTLEEAELRVRQWRPNDTPTAFDGWDESEP